MTRYNPLHRALRGVAAMAIAAAMTLVGCTTVNETLGEEFIPSNQGMHLGERKLSSEATAYFETRLFKTDSINSTNLGSGYFGRSKSDTFGIRTAGFYTQYVPGNFLVEDEGFGYRPIYDSTTMHLTVTTHGVDTNTIQSFEVYEVINDDFVRENEDSLFFINFEMKPENLSAEPIYTFQFPDQENGVYTTTEQIRLHDTELTAEFIKRLMLLDDSKEYDTDIYGDDPLWVKNFKGLYIKPVSENEGQGSIYATDLEASGFSIYGRSRMEDDPTIIKDTVGMTYIFYVEEAEAGNVSINNIKHDYLSGLIDESTFVDDSKELSDNQLTSTIQVEGMGGVVTQIAFTPELFAEIEDIIDTESSEENEEFSSLYFNQAKMMIYLTQESGGMPNYEDINPSIITPWLDVMPARLGLYSSYASYMTEDAGIRLVGVADYNYLYESYGYELDFGGELNRSWGCYVFNISNHLQSVWNSYLEAKDAANGDVSQINWDDVKFRTIYLAPLASDLYSMKFSTLQGMNIDGGNNAPIKLDLTYTLIK